MLLLLLLLLLLAFSVLVLQGRSSRSKKRKCHYRIPEPPQSGAGSELVSIVVCPGASEGLADAPWWIFVTALYADQRLPPKRFLRYENTADHGINPSDSYGFSAEPRRCAAPNQRNAGTTCASLPCSIHTYVIRHRWPQVKKEVCCVRLSTSHAAKAAWNSH